MAEPWKINPLDYLFGRRTSEPILGLNPQKPDTHVQVAPASIVAPVNIIELGIAPEAHEFRGWFRRALSAVGHGLSIAGNVIFSAGNPGYDDDFAATYQPSLSDFCPTGRQCGIFFPMGGVGPGFFVEEDLALGIHENLAGFRGGARIGTDLPVTDDLWSALTKGIEDTAASGGRIRFNLDGVDVGGAFDSASPVYNTYTSRELRYISSSVDLRQRTVFYSQGVETTIPH